MLKRENTCCCCKCFGCSEAIEPLDGIVRLKAEVTYNTNRTYPNGTKAPDGIEVRFGAARPTAEVREMLKAHGFKFSEKQTLWYARDNQKSRELAEYLENNEVDADDTQYEKLHFWAKVGSLEFYGKLSNYTEFMIKSEPPRFFRTKRQLENSVTDPKAYVLNDMLRFKKFYNKVVGEDTEEGNEPETEESGEDNESKSVPGINIELAEKFHKLAKGLDKQIDSKLNSGISKQRPTARRMRIAASMRQEGYFLQRIQGILLCLAAAHRTGLIENFTFLPNVRSKADVELLLKSQTPEGAFFSMEQIQRSFPHYKDSLAQLGIENAGDWVNAMNEATSLVEGFRKAFGEDQEKQQQSELIKQREMEIKSMKIPGFFPTPKNLIERLLELAELKQDDAILEPSAGKGDILDAVREYFGENEPDLDAIEVNSKLRELLELKGYNVIASDFLSYDDTAYDKIIMNPPFENGQDIDHVRHAFDLLKHGGRLVAIMSEGPFFRQFKKDTEFREWLSEQNAYVSEPIKDAFKNSFNSTGVTVRIVAINEDGSYPEPKEESDMEPEENKEETDQLELEAEAELELMKMKFELEKRKKGLSGFEDVDREKQTVLKLKAMAIDLPEILDWK